MTEHPPNNSDQPAAGLRAHLGALDPDRRGPSGPGTWQELSDVG